MGEHRLLGSLDTPRTFRQEIGEDVLPITLVKVGGRIQGRMRQAALRLSAPLATMDSLAEALGLDADDVEPFPAARAADTGAAHLMVRLRDVQAVDRATPSAEALLAVLGTAGAEGCYVYALVITETGVKTRSAQKEGHISEVQDIQRERIEDIAPDVAIQVVLGRCCYD